MTDTLERDTTDALENISNAIDLKTHKNIHINHGYNILKLDENYAKVSINTNKSETVDKSTTIYDGSLFSAANFCAMASINQESLFLLSANVEFLNQADSSDDDIVFVAKASNNLSGKKQIEVKGSVNDITIFQGSFTAIKLENNSLIKDTKKGD
jgi:acyl-coenzyme A thioesterase PaaI-like protein